MKRLFFVFLLFLTSCGQINTEAVPTVTPTTFVLPTKTPVPTQTPTLTPTIVPTSTTTPFVDKPLFYTIKSGDTLLSIATQTGLDVATLVSINHLKSEDWIYTDQVLMLVSKDEVLEQMYAEPGKKILVNLTTQQTFAIEGDQIIKTFLVSTGIPSYPTRVGKYQIWVKLAETRMIGPGYDLSHVKWTMYFDQSRGFHAKYWNDIYGRPSSHGCVNMREADAKWLYDWADPPTTGIETYPTTENPGTNVWIIP